MDVKSMKKKLKKAKCLFCRLEFYEKDLLDCPYDDCPIGTLCDKCMKEHLKHHEMEDAKNGYSQECMELFNSLNGEVRIEKGNFTGGLW